ncbi:MAG: hypothetical protein RLN85_09365, partial [Pseudomonadales bacterium]
ISLKGVWLARQTTGKWYFNIPKYRNATDFLAASLRVFFRIFACNLPYSTDIGLLAKDSM